MRTSACILGCSGKRLLADERSLFGEIRPLGFILFDRNAGTVDEIRRLTDELREAAGHDALVLVDHEGGRVQRFRGKAWRDWLPALDQCGRVASNLRARSMWLRHRIIADELAIAGINVNCVPLADLAAEETHPILRNRCYGTNPDSVVSVARSVAEGCLAGGVLPVLKHIPGHGGTVSDSHIETPVNSRTFGELDDTEFRAFRELNDLPLGMTAHVVYNALDPKRPATMSQAAIEFVRSGIGFDGLLMTDDISMAALETTVAERVEGSLKAGCDAVLHCNGVMSEMESVGQAAGTLRISSQFRFERAINAIRPTAADLGAMIDELAGIEGALP